MNLPDININVGTPQHPDEQETGHATTPRLWFAMVPEDVRRDVRLTHRDLHVYMELAGARNGCIANIGERLLAKYCRIDRRGVRESVSRLAEFGHVDIKAIAKRTRARYRLTSPRFAVEPATEKAAEVSANPHGHTEKRASNPPPKRDLVRCPLCQTRCRQILRVGWCRRCGTDKRMEKIAQRVVREEKTA